VDMAYFFSSVSEKGALAIVFRALSYALGSRCAVLLSEFGDFMESCSNEVDLLNSSPVLF
jgi:hypothetical protein